MCCLALAIWKTTFLFGNYKSQSALWKEHASYQLAPSTNSQIWIRNQFLKKTPTGQILPIETQKRSETAQKQGKFVICKDTVQEFLSWGAAKNILSLRRAAQHRTGDVGAGCCGDGVDF